MEKVILHESSFWGETSTIILDGGYGFVMISVTDRNESVAIMHDLMVHKDKRGSGLGRKLIQEACEEAGTMGADILRLSVDPHSWLVGWYDRNGFEPIGASVYEGTELLVMEKEIRREAVEPQLP